MSRRLRVSCCIWVLVSNRFNKSALRGGGGLRCQGFDGNESWTWCVQKSSTADNFGQAACLVLQVDLWLYSNQPTLGSAPKRGSGAGTQMAARQY